LVGTRILAAGQIGALSCTIDSRYIPENLVLPPSWKANSTPQHSRESTHPQLAPAARGYRALGITYIRMPRRDVAAPTVFTRDLVMYARVRRRQTPAARVRST